MFDKQIEEAAQKIADKAVEEVDTDEIRFIYGTDKLDWSEFSANVYNRALETLQQAVAAERERAAQVAEKHYLVAEQIPTGKPQWQWVYGKNIAAAIREGAE